MADKIKGILLKPLNGAPIGSDCEYLPSDFKRLKGRHAVKEAEAPQNKAAALPMNKSRKKGARK